MKNAANNGKIILGILIIIIAWYLIFLLNKPHIERVNLSKANTGISASAGNKKMRFYMKPFLTIFSFILLFTACSQTHDTPDPVFSPTRTALLAHSWVQDSAATVSGGVYHVVYPFPAPTVTYKTEYYVTAKTVQPPYDTTYYELEEPDKIYYWYKGSSKNANDYFLIDSLTDERFVVKFPGNPAAYEWYHAK